MYPTVQAVPPAPATEVRVDFSLARTLIPTAFGSIAVKGAMYDNIVHQLIPLEPGIFILLSLRNHGNIGPRISADASSVQVTSLFLFTPERVAEISFVKY